MGPENLIPSFETLIRRAQKDIQNIRAGTVYNAGTYITQKRTKGKGGGGNEGRGSGQQATTDRVLNERKETTVHNQKKKCKAGRRSSKEILEDGGRPVTERNQRGREPKLTGYMGAARTRSVQYIAWWIKTGRNQEWQKGTGGKGSA